MKSAVRKAVIVVALMIIPAIVLAQPKGKKRAIVSIGKMSVEELHQEPVTFQLDIPYTDTGNSKHKLDLYLPNSRKTAKLPVVVFFHGGGWMIGDKSDGARSLMVLMRTGQYAGISAGYRLSGEVKWPAQIYDCKAVIRWVRANAAKYGFNPERIAVWGMSAGGHLALMLGASGGITGLEGDLGPHNGMSSKVSAVVDFAGPSDFPALLGQPSDIDRTRSDAIEARLIGGALQSNPDKAKSASPITYVASGDPPVLTVHGTVDRIIPYDQALRMDAALRKAGVPSYLITVKGGGHLDFGNAANERVKAFLDKYLCGKNAEISTEPINQPVLDNRQ